MRNCILLVAVAWFFIALPFIATMQAVHINVLREKVHELKQRCDWQRDKISELVLDSLDDETGVVGHPLPWPRPEVQEVGVL